MYLTATFPHSRAFVRLCHCWPFPSLLHSLSALPHNRDSCSYNNAISALSSMFVHQPPCTRTRARVYYKTVYRPRWPVGLSLPASLHQYGAGQAIPLAITIRMNGYVQFNQLCVVARLQRCLGPRSMHVRCPCPSAFPSQFSQPSLSKHRYSRSHILTVG